MVDGGLMQWDGVRNQPRAEFASCHWEFLVALVSSKGDYGRGRTGSTPHSVIHGNSLIVLVLEYQ